MSTEAAQPPQSAATPNPNPPPEWISVAQLWLASNFSGGIAPPSLAQFEAWFETIAGSLPEEIVSTPRSQLYQILMENSPVNQEQGVVQNGKHAKFQRTDQWQPVYTWLESLDKDEVVRSEDITDWLEKNPGVKEELSAKHSRYHLMHYIKKCHFKILKRRDIKKGLLVTGRAVSAKIRKRKEFSTRELVQFSPHPMTKMHKNDDLHLAKRNEAAQKFEILVEFEKRLMAQFLNS